MTLSQSIQSAQASARKLFGSDISIVIVKACAFGNDSNLAIVSGANCKQAAASFAIILKGAEFSHSSRFSDFSGEVIHSTEIKWP